MTVTRTPHWMFGLTGTSNQTSVASYIIGMLSFKRVNGVKRLTLTMHISGFYREMHYSTYRGIEIACRPSVCAVGGSVPHKLEILETNCTDN